MREEIKISGYGGQGVITLGKMLTHAAVHYQNLSAVQTSAYGVAARGGSCWTEVVISDEDIDYPRVRNPKYLILLSQDAVYEYGDKIREGGTILYDSSTVKEIPKGEMGTVYEIPATRLSKEKLNSPQSANVIILGFFTKLSGILSEEDGRKIIKELLPENTADSNIKAFDLGFSLEKK